MGMYSRMIRFLEINPIDSIDSPGLARLLFWCVNYVTFPWNCVTWFILSHRPLPCEILLSTKHHYNEQINFLHSGNLSVVFICPDSNQRHYEPCSSLRVNHYRT